MRSVDKDAAATAIAFVNARRRATPLATYPGVLPPTLAAGYAIQSAAIALQDQPVAGWKVGRINPPFDARFGSDRLAGPIFAPRVVAATASGTPMGVFAGGFGAVEAEFIFRLGEVDPARTAYDLAGAAACVDAVFAGIEVASSPLAAINDLGPAVTVSDFGNNHGLIVGPEIDGWRDVAIDDWPVTMAIDGEPVGHGTAAAFPGGTLGAVCFLLEQLARHGIVAPPGTLVSTGAISGVHPVCPGQRAVAQFAGRIELRCTITKAEPSRD